ncbi:uncharacterized protein THITE_2116660 [Thermothielavioides terrestris NRRL 8126]|uniref:Uncharacterized protein n=1 Tax=Thermothielavioides terrestris (strain ATCC 38088 / NRRL 8126) TaxID=578455 RepID=G2R6Y9_THETT|nr:uncharacterized protein THITE_2116660 [Thermothielavioides terrestris NRRL 8126]AEO67717.1 hypothetical protein THITE_2116660 [Thermothielavioides terrestris NRRL 8126]
MPTFLPSFLPTFLPTFLAQPEAYLSSPAGSPPFWPSRKPTDLAQPYGTSLTCRPLYHGNCQPVGPGRDGPTRC